MSHRTAAWLAWSLWAVCVALIALALVLDFLTDDVPFPITSAIRSAEGFAVLPGILPFGERPGPAFAVLTGVISLAYPTVGALIASRLPTNPIGWIFCGVGLLYTARGF